MTADCDIHPTDNGHVRQVSGRYGDSGVALILALVFIVAMGVTFIALATSVGNGLLSSNNLTAQRSLEYAADSAANMAVQNVRYSGLFAEANETASVACLPGAQSTPTETITIDGVNTFVDCTQVLYDPFSAVTRVVDVNACIVSAAVSAGASTCTTSNAVIQGQVAFDDVAVGATSPECTQGGDTASCGSSMQINAWIFETGNN